MAIDKWIHLDVKLEIAVQGPLHIGTGYDRGLVHRTVVRDGYGHVYIPGSSLKGKVRNACEDLARCSGLGVCGLPRVAEAISDANHHPERCLVCRVFGCPGGNDSRGRALYWQDARLAEKWRSLTSVQGRRRAWNPDQTLLRTQVQLSRARGMAAEGRLFTSESTLGGMEFEGRVAGWLKAMPCSGATGYHELNLLLAGLRLVDMLGGGRSRGPGRCRISLPGEIEVRVEGQADARKYGLPDLLAAAEWLALFPDELGQGDGGNGP